MKTKSFFRNLAAAALLSLCNCVATGKARATSNAVSPSAVAVMVGTNGQLSSPANFFAANSNQITANTGPSVKLQFVDGNGITNTAYSQFDTSFTNIGATFVILTGSPGNYHFSTSGMYQSNGYAFGKLVIPKTINAGPVLEWDFTEGYGLIAYNKAAHHPFQNFGYGPAPFNFFGDSVEWLPDASSGQSLGNSSYFAVTNASAVGYYGEPFHGGQFLDPVGGYTASQVYITNTTITTHYNAFRTNRSGSMTFSIWLKTATTNDTFNMQFSLNGGGAYQYTSPTFTASNTWQRFVWTTNSIPYSSNCQWVALNPTGVEKRMLCTIWGAQVECGPTATPVPDLNWDLVLGQGFSQTPTAPTWTNNALRFGAANIQAFATGKNPLRIPAFSWYCVLRRTNTASMFADYGSGTGNPQTVIVDNYAAFTQPIWGFQFGANNTGTAGFFVGESTKLVSTGDNALADGNYHVICTTYDGNTNAFIYYDDVICGYGVGASSVNRIPDLYRIMVGSPMIYGGTTAGFQGEIAYMSIYDTPHSQAQVVANDNAIRNLMYQKNINVPMPQALVAFEGDSVTDARGTLQPYNPGGAGNRSFTNSWSWRAAANLNPQITVANFAQSGATITSAAGGTNSLQARQAMVQAQYAIGRPNILVVYAGINEANPTAEAALNTYCNAFRSQGWKVVASTIYAIPGLSAVTLSNNTVFNAYVRSNTPVFWDYLNDFAADPLIGNYNSITNAAYTNNVVTSGVEQAYFELGNPHIGPKGQWLMTKYVSTNLNTILGPYGINSTFTY